MSFAPFDAATLPRQVVRLPREMRPVLSVVIHTEEEFDWGKSFDRNATGVEHMRHIGRAQGLFERFGIVPNYVIGYPTATQALAYEPLRDFAQAGRALIGAHLHPWVCPPYDEEVSTRNSYPGNLAAELERGKLEVLTETIADTFGTPPLTYLAGRYGFGRNTAAILEDLGYEVDISTAASIDYTGDGGPDYSRIGSEPFWFGQRRRLLGLPGTGGFLGRLQRLGPWLYPLATDARIRFTRLPGILSRLGLLERIRLSPEDYDVPDLERLTRGLLARGVRVFVFSFHSPSIDPGHTPYVPDRAALERFLTKCQRYLDFFFGEVGGETRTPLEVKALLENGDGAEGIAPVT
jgi:hypothetical protein